MAFTRGWDATTPLGTRAANEIDNAIRELKVDIEERLESKIFDSLPNTTDEADLDVKPEILGNVTGKVLCIGHAAFQPNSDDDDISREDAYTQSDNDSGSYLYATFSLPNGVTITDIDVLCDKNGGTSVTVEPYKINPSTGAKTAVGATFSRSSAGIGLASSATLSETVAGSYYMIKVSHSPLLSSRFRLYGATITYDVPDCRNTL